jgi:hypothetical protein
MSSGAITSAPSPGGGKSCPECGAIRYRLGAHRCWLCNADLAAVPEVQEGRPSADAERGLVPVPHGERHFRLQTRPDSPALIVIAVLFLMVAAALIVSLPGLGIILAILATPALVRAVMVAGRRQREGAPLTPGEKAGAFLTSLGIVVTVGVASFAAFWVTCFALVMGGLTLSGESSWGLVFLLSICAGLVPGGLVLYHLGPKLWRRGA